MSSETGDDRATNYVKYLNAGGNARLQVGNYTQTNNYNGSSQCLVDLRLTNPRDDKKRIEETKGGLLEASYRWIRDHATFRQWRNDRECSLLWIKGDPGKGKTMLLCGIIDELGTDPKALLVYFFCQASNTNLNHATAVLRGLVWLLVDKEPSLTSLVQKKYDQSGRGLFEDENSWYAMSDIFKEVLQNTRLQNTLLVVDGLDECTTGLQQLLKLIKQTSSSSYRAKWIVSSRNWMTIEEMLEVNTQNLQLCLELNQDSVSEAVGIYIEDQVERLARRKKYDENLRQDVHHHLVSNAKDTFLWVSLVCQELAKVQRRHTKNTLKSFPSGLDSIYERMMNQIRNSVDSDLCKEILAVASIAYRPVTMKELAFLVGPLKEFHDDVETLNEIIGLCGSFLILRDGVLYFVHQSAKDFLLAKTSQEIMPSGIANQHRVISSTSLEILSRTLRRDIYNLRDPGLRFDQVCPPNPDPLAPIRYSCVYWIEHLLDSVDTQTDASIPNDTLLTFFQKKYLCWLEALSLLHSVPEGTRAIQRLDAYYKTGATQQPADLIRDAYRFVLSHRASIEVAPLQVYMSALVFTPSRSLIKKIYEEEAPKWVALNPAVEESWNPCLQTLEGHTWAVRSVAFSPDGLWLASGADDSTVKIWDTTGRCVATLTGHTGPVRAVTFSADSQKVASGSIDQTIKIWDIADMGTAHCDGTLEGVVGTMWHLEFSSDGRQLTSVSKDTTAQIWDVVEGCVETQEGHGDQDPATIIPGISADGKLMAISYNDRTLKIWDTNDESWVATFDDNPGLVNSVSFLTGSQRIASGSDDMVTLKIWDMETGRCIANFDGHSHPITSVAYSARTQRIASGSFDYTIKVWDASLNVEDSATGNGTAETNGSLKDRHSMVFSADSRRLASISSDGTVKIWDMPTGHLAATFRSGYALTRSVAISANNQWFAASSSLDRIEIWDIETSRLVKTLEGHTHSVESIVFSADSQLVVSGSLDKTIKIWDMATSHCIRSLEEHGYKVASVNISTDSQKVISGSFSNTVEVWDVATGGCTSKLWGHTGPVQAVAFTADNQRAASSSYDHTIRIWNVATGHTISAVFVGDVTTHLSFHPKHDSQLCTKFGILDLSLLPTAKSKRRNTLPRFSNFIGYGIGAGGKWITRDGKNVLRLPWEYRPVTSAVMGMTVAIGCRRSQVQLIRFLPREPGI